MSGKAILIVSLGLVAIYNILFYHTELGVGTSFLFLLFNSFFYLTKNPQTSNYRWAMLLSAVSTFFAFLFALRANGLVQVLDVFASLFLALSSVFFYKRTQRIILKTSSFLLSPLSSHSKLFLV